MTNVVLMGFMGTGKSSTGKMLALRLGCSFLDLDHYIEQQTEKSVAEIFAEQGEAHFRCLERRAVREITARQNLVLATGGGTVADDENRRLLKDWGVTVCLKASVEVILARTACHGERPLLERLSQGERRQATETLLQRRARAYDEADYFVDTSELSPLQVVEEITRCLRRGGTHRG
ncbi:MAG: shikimate kinase [Schwartzia sp. (in: firmicutes)]